MKFHFSGNRTAMIFANRRIVFSSRIYVFMAQDVRDNINISRFAIKSGAVCGTQLVRRYLFQRSYDFCVLFHEIFNRADRNSAIL